MLNDQQWSQLLLSFVEEAHDLAKQAEEYLLQLEQTPTDEDAINGLFRAMHTLKGSAGLFSLTPLVNFTHHLESLLMKVREGQQALTPVLLDLLLRGLDEVNAMVELIDADSGELVVDEALHAGLIAALTSHDDSHLIPLTTIEPDTCKSFGRLDKCASCDQEAAWHISLRLQPEILGNGFDPASFLRYLARLGDILQLELIDDALPALAEMDPESCYLGMEIDLCTTAGKAEIEDVFEFIRDFCTLRILPPNAALDD